MYKPLARRTTPVGLPGQYAGAGEVAAYLVSEALGFTSCRARCCARTAPYTARARYSSTSTAIRIITTSTSTMTTSNACAGGALRFARQQRGPQRQPCSDRERHAKSCGPSITGCASMTKISCGRSCGTSPVNRSRQTFCTVLRTFRRFFPRVRTCVLRSGISHPARDRRARLPREVAAQSQEISLAASRPTRLPVSARLVPRGRRERYHQAHRLRRNAKQQSLCSFSCIHARRYDVHFPV